MAHDLDGAEAVLYQLQGLARLGFQRGELPFQVGQRPGFGPEVGGARAIGARGGDQQAVSGGHAGGRRADDGPHADLLRDVIGVQRSAAARAQQHEIAGVAAAFGQVHPRRARHVLGHDVVDAPGNVHGFPVQLPGEGPDGHVRPVPVDAQRAAGEIVGVEVSQQQVGVGDRGRLATQRIAGRARLGARAQGADLEQLQFVLMRDAAPAGADLDQVNRGDADGQAAAFGETFAPRRFETVGDGRRAAFHQGQLGGGAAHVEGQQVRLLVADAVVGGGDRPAGRSGFQQFDRIAARLAQVAESAVGQHHQYAAAQAQRGQLVFQRGEIAIRQRLDVSVGDRGRATLEFADDRRHLGRQRKADIGQGLPDPGVDLLFVPRRCVGMQQADGDGGRTGVGQAVRHGDDRLAIERFELVAMRVEPAWNFAAQVPGHQWRGRSMARSYRSYLRSLPISIASMKPWLHSRPVLAPARLIRALVNSVVACTTRPTSDAAMPHVAINWRTPSMTARDGSSYVVSILRLCSLPPA